MYSKVSVTVLRALLRKYSRFVGYVVFTIKSVKLDANNFPHKLDRTKLTKICAFVQNERSTSVVRSSVKKDVPELV
jgi:hypothetical protein